MSDFRIKVLVADDNRNMRKLVASILRGARFGDVVEAPDGIEACSAVIRWRPDLLICDLEMPMMDGLDVARWVRRDATSPDPFLPMILMTSKATKAGVAAARDAGFDEVLAKPLTAEALFRRIEAVTLRRRPFVRIGQYFGPCRRRGVAPNNDAIGERRGVSDMLELT